MIKRFFLSTIFSLALFSYGFAKEVNKKNTGVVEDSPLILIRLLREAAFDLIYTKAFCNKYNLDLYKDDNWRFLARKFNDDLLNLFDEEKSQKKFLQFIFALFGGGLILTNMISKRQMTKCDDLLIGAFITSIIFIILKLIYEYNLNLNVQQRNYEILHRFLIKWDEYKSITPKELHDLFDKLKKDSDHLISGETTSNLVGQIRSLAVKNDTNPSLIKK